MATDPIVYKDILAALRNQTGAFKVITANYTVLPTDGLLICDSTDGAFTVTLPPCADFADRRLIIVLRTDGGNVDVALNATDQGLYADADIAGQDMTAVNDFMIIDNVIGAFWLLTKDKTT